MKVYFLIRRDWGMPPHSPLQIIKGRGAAVGLHVSQWRGNFEDRGHCTSLLHV